MPAPTGRTFHNNLPYPLETDGADPARDIKALAERLDEIIVFNALIPVGGEAEWAGENDPNPNWMVEDGRLLVRATYLELFEEIGTKYNKGGEAGTEFRIPDTRGRVSVGAGKGEGLTNRELGKTLGTETVTLTAKQSGLPQHSHQLVQSDGSTGANISYIAGGNFGQTGDVQTGKGYNNGFLGVSKAGPTGAEESHTNMPPVIVKNKIIRVL